MTGPSSPRAVPLSCGASSAGDDIDVAAIIIIARRSRRSSRRPDRGTPARRAVAVGLLRRPRSCSVELDSTRRHRLATRHPRLNRQRARRRGGGLRRRPRRNREPCHSVDMLQMPTSRSTSGWICNSALRGRRQAGARCESRAAGMLHRQPAPSQTRQSPQRRRRAHAFAPVTRTTTHTWGKCVFSEATSAGPLTLNRQTSSGLARASQTRSPWPVRGPRDSYRPGTATRRLRRVRPRARAAARHDAARGARDRADDRRDQLG